jgi:hypothetical protein
LLHAFRIFPCLFGLSCDFLLFLHPLVIKFFILLSSSNSFFPSFNFTLLLNSFSPNSHLSN